MLRPSFTLLGAALLLPQGQCNPGHIAVPDVPKNSSAVPRDLQSFSIEFAYFPDFAGNKSSPNEFSKALLGNLQQLTGVSPIVRVGGTTQDHATYFPRQEDSIHLIYKDPSDDQPTQINYGPGFFESYHTLGDIKYIHGLNLNQSDPVHLETSAEEACRLIGSKLYLFELGNEFNLSPLTYRSSSNYSIEAYVREWNTKSASLMKTVRQACGDFPGLMAPSFFLLDNIDLSPFIDEFGGQIPVSGMSSMLEFVNSTNTAEKLFNHGFDENNMTKELSFHNYLGLNMPFIPSSPNDLQETLMNHTNIIEALNPHIQRAQNLAHLGYPYILGETNSIGNQGRNGVSNLFGGALWVIDYSLWAAEHNIKRLHFHQGLDYRYASWQPIGTKEQAPTTRPPYYGHIMVASALGRSSETRVANIPLSEDTESAYGIYDVNKLVKLVVLNLRAFNQTTGTRPSKSYSFLVPEQFSYAKAERLISPGSDAVDNITFNGISYDYDLKQGEPVVVGLQNEMIAIQDGILSVTLSDSSAVLLTLG